MTAWHAATCGYPRTLSSNFTAASDAPLGRPTLVLPQVHGKVSRLRRGLPLPKHRARRVPKASAVRGRVIKIREKTRAQRRAGRLAGSAPHLQVSWPCRVQTGGGDFHGSRFRMHAGSPRRAWLLGRIVVATAMVFVMVGVVCAQSAPARRTLSSSSLSIEAAPSPSAGSLAPVVDGSAAAGRVDRLRKLVRGASSCTLRPLAGGDLHFAESARVQLGTPYATMLETTLDRSTTSHFESRATLELGAGAPLGLLTARPESVTFATAHADARQVGLGSAPTANAALGAQPLHGFSPGFSQGSASPTAPLIVPASQPFSLRVRTPTGFDAGTAGP